MHTTDGLTHDALLYDSERVYLDTVVPFLREGIANGEGTVVATSQRNSTLVRDALGDDASHVVFADGDVVYRRPESAIAAYDAVLRDMAAAGFHSVRAIGEVQHGTSGQERWLPYEPVADRVFQDRPLWVICPYDTRSLPSWIIDHARRTHTHLRTPDRFENPLLVDAEELVAMARPAPRLDPDGPPMMRFSVSDRLSALREQVVRAFGPDHPADMDSIVIAMNELASNAVRHGSGTAHVSLWDLPDGIVCDIFDPAGRIDDVFAGYRPPVAPADGGMGLWIARQLSDEFTIVPGQGLTIRLGFFR